VTTNQEGVHAAVRAVTSTTRSYNEDWHALFDSDSITAGTFNERMLAWINATLGTSYTSLPGAMNAFAVDQGFSSWSAMNTFIVSGAAALLSGETNGLAFSADDQSMVIKDTTTPANNYNSSGIVNSSGTRIGIDGKLTYSTTSVKNCLQEDGTYKYNAHNIALRSEDFSHAAWTKDGFTVGSTATEPGGATAYLLLETATTALHQSHPTAVVTIAAGTPTYISCVVKAEGRSWIYLGYSEDTSGLTRRVWFGVTGSGSVGTTDAEITSPAITSLGGDWYLCSFVATDPEPTGFFPRVGSASADGTSSFAGDTAKGVYATKFHVRRENSNTDYIKTDGTALYALPYEYDTSGNMLGIRVEESRANLLTYSTQFNNAAWVPGGYGVSATANVAISPDGTITADKLVSSAGTSQQRLQLSNHGLTTSAGTYTLSVFAKSGEWNFLTLNMFDTVYKGACFDLTTGAVTLQSGVTASAEQCPDGSWWRLSITATITTALNYVVSGFWPAAATPGTLNASVTGDGVSGVYVWQAQLELGSFPTSPIITYGTSLTRAADNIFILNTAYPFNGDLATFYARISPAIALSNFTAAAYNSSGSYGAGNGLLLRFANSSDVTVSTSMGGNATTANKTFAGPLTAGSFVKIAGAADDALNEAVVTANGLTVSTTITTLDWTGSGDRLQIGAITSSGAQALNGHIKEFMMWPRRASAAELVTVTT
jgi:hypothetical protein